MAPRLQGAIDNFKIKPDDWWARDSPIADLPKVKEKERKLLGDEWDRLSLLRAKWLSSDCRVKYYKKEIFQFDSYAHIQSERT